MRDARELREENADLHRLLRHQSKLLRGVVNTIRGPPDFDGWWSVHDAIDLVRNLKRERDLLAEAETPPRTSPPAETESAP